MKKSSRIITCLTMVGLLFCSTSVCAEGNLVIYTARSDSEIELVVPAFEEAYGVEVELVTGGIGELIKRVEAEGNSPQGDILLGGTYTSNLSGSNYYESYISPEMENLAEEYRREDGLLTTTSIIAVCMIVNDNLAEGIKLEGWEDLLNPELKGKIAFADPAASSNAYNLLVNMLYDMGEGDVFSDAAWEYVGKFVDQLDGKILSSSSATPRGVADGEYTVGLTHEVYVANYIAEGAPVHAQYFSEGTYVAEDVVAIIKNCENMDNAKLFVDYLLSYDCQNNYMIGNSTRPSRTDVASPETLPDVEELNSIGEYAVSSEDKAQILDQFNELMYQ